VRLLNDGSVCAQSSDSASAHVDRARLAKLCFECLLNMSSGAQPDLVPEQHGGGGSSNAVDSLLTRCATVLREYERDDRLAGGVPLPRVRTQQVCHVMQAIATIIQSVTTQTTTGGSTGSVGAASIRHRLVELYPSCVACARCRPTADVHAALESTLLAFALLMR